MHEQERTPRCLDYILRVLLGEQHYGEGVRRRIVYQTPVAKIPDRAAMCIVQSGFFARDYGTPASLPILPLQEIEGVPLLFGSPKVERHNGKLVVQADIIASAYFLVTRYEEIVRRDVRDEHGRFPGRESLPYRAGFIDRPIVEEYGALLRKWLREVGVDVPEPKRKFSMLLTHDVDHLRKYSRPFPIQPLRTTARALLRGQPVRDIPESLAVSLGLRKDPFDTFDDLTALDASVNHGAVPGGSQSLYFFMAGGNGPFEGTYDVRSRAARKTIRKVVQSGATVGLHASYEAGMHPERIAGEKARLEEVCERPIRHNRHHYLAWREVEDGWALAKAGIESDSTLGYAQMAGFRLGVCHPIPLFDPVSCRPFGIEEHPLIVMDCTLSRPDYMGLSEPEAQACCRRLLAETRKHDGEFVILWHNNSLAREPDNYHPRLYRELLTCAASGGADADENDPEPSLQAYGQGPRAQGRPPAGTIRSDR